MALLAPILHLPKAKETPIVFLDSLFPRLSNLTWRNLSLLLAKICYVQACVCGLSSFPLAAPIAL